jgi:hypothetical protein
MTIENVPSLPNRNQAGFSDQVDTFITWFLETFPDQFNADIIALNLNSTIGTSSTSNSVGTGAKTFTANTAKSWQPGMWVLIADTAAPSTNYMAGPVTSYNSGTGALVVNVAVAVGSGTKTAWTISQSAPGGATLGANNFTGAQNFARATVASAASPDIWSALGNQINYTGTTLATSFTTAPQAGASRTLILAGASGFTASANMLIEGVASGQSIILEANDLVTVEAITTTQFRLSIKKYNGRSSAYPVGYIYGLQCANAADTDHDITISTGCARSATDNANIELTSNLTKRADAAWAVGDTNGGMFTGALANATTYHLFLIKRSDTGVVDAGWDTSITAANRPASYDSYRLILSLKTDASANFRPFEQNGNAAERQIRYLTPVLDIDNVAQSTTYVSTTLSVPTGKRFNAFGNIYRAGAANGVINVRSPNHTDGTPSLTASPLSMSGIASAVASGGSNWSCHTNTASQVQTAAQSSCNLYMTTSGYVEYL